MTGIVFLQASGTLTIVLAITFALAYVAQCAAQRLTRRVRAELACDQSRENLMALPVWWLNRFFVFWLLMNAIWLITVAAQPILQCLATLLMLTVLGMLALVDAETGILPNELVLLLIVMAWGYSWLIKGDGLPALNRLWGMTLGYALPMLFNGVYRWVRAREALGQGDAKLLAAIGLWVGLSALADVWIIASALLLVYTACSWFANQAVVRLRTGIPFGPFLVLATNALVICESF